MKKLLYQLECDYPCNFSMFFDQEIITRFQQEVTENIVFRDTDGFKVMTLQPDCTIVVHRGYRWDGCSPKVNIFDLFWIGIPDGAVIGSERIINDQDEDQDIPIVNERITHYASAAHDVLGYCKRDSQMPSLFKAYGKDLWFSPGRKARDRLFLKILEQKQFSLRFIYYYATALFGPFFDFLFGKSSVTNEPHNN